LGFHFRAGRLKLSIPSTERTLPWKCLQVVVRILTTLLFDLKVYGRDNVPARGGALIVSNHQGNLDAVLIAVRLDRPLNFIAKSELFQSRRTSWFLHMLNAFPVRQGAGDVGAVRETIRRLQAGHLINIFPEGSRTEDGRIGPLQKGVTPIVHRAGVPVIPAVIVGSFEAWPIHRRFFRPWPVRIKLGPPMELAHLESDQMIETIDHTLHAMFDELRNHPEKP
jgi:1-acyl-sn-glycerol-3-phosphate acyltransferase